MRTVLDFLREGDLLTVTRIARRARSIGDLQDIVRAVRARGASLKATEQPIDTSTAAGKCFLDMLGVFAEFETNLRRERQLEGIAKAKAAGVYKGRPASIDAAQVKAMKAQGLGASEIAKALKIGRASVYSAGGRLAAAALDGRVIPDLPHTRKRLSHAKTSQRGQNRPDSRTPAATCMTRGADRVKPCASPKSGRAEWGRGGGGEAP
jgi:DNA invertase Pin-like site-specific DNA recombinase